MEGKGAVGEELVAAKVGSNDRLVKTRWVCGNNL